MCICVYATSPRILRHFSIFDMMAVVRARWAGYFIKPRQNATMDNHYSLSDWFDHDDDSNTFFHYWLDRDHRMYSCGKWDPDTTTLQEAETNKLECYATRMGIDERSRGKTLLDLGCGWGGVLFFMAEKFGIRSKGLTLSSAQHRYITQEIQRRQVQDLVTVELRNVHNMEGKYDYIISMGMLEHISDFDDLYEKTARAVESRRAGADAFDLFGVVVLQSGPLVYEIHFPIRSVSKLFFQHEMLQEVFQCRRAEQDAVFVLSENARRVV